MSLITQPPQFLTPEPVHVIGRIQQPHDFLGEFLRTSGLVGIDGSQSFDQLWTHGVVYKTPDVLVMGGPDGRRNDAWWVWWAQKNPNVPTSAVAAFLKAMPYFRPYVGWTRMLKGKAVPKYYSTKRLMSLTHFENDAV